jgi:hypothetical protein
MRSHFSKGWVALKTELVCFYEMWVDFHKSTQCYMAEEPPLQEHLILIHFVVSVNMTDALFVFEILMIVYCILR